MNFNLSHKVIVTDAKVGPTEELKMLLDVAKEKHVASHCLGTCQYS